MAADTLYEEDIVAWAEQQARAIRDLARARPELTNALDWENVAEEIDEVGQSFFLQFESLGQQFLVHLAKLLSAPRSEAAPHWRAEAVAFHDGALRRFAPSMRRKLDLDSLWLSALRQATAALVAQGDVLADDLGARCPIELDEFLRSDFDLDRAVALASGRLGRSGSAP